MIKISSLNLIKRLSFMFVMFVIIISGINASGSSDSSSSGIEVVCSINQADELGCWSSDGNLESFPSGFNTNIKEVSVWASFACVINNNNNLFCDYIGPRNSELSFDIPDYWKENIKTVSVGYRLFCVVNLNDEMNCFAYGQSTEIPKGLNSNIQNVVAGISDTCVIDLNNKLSCWDFDGNLFNIPKEWEKVKSVDTKNSYFCTVNLYDDVFCWDSMGNGMQEYDFTDKKLNSISIGRGQNVCGITIEGILDCNFEHSLPDENIKSVNLGLTDTLCVVNKNNELICESGYEPPGNWKYVKQLGVNDLSIDLKDVTTSNNLIEFIVNSENIAGDVEINIKRQNEEGIIVDEYSKVYEIKYGVNKLDITKYSDLKNGEYIHVIINSENEFNLGNNYLMVPIMIDNLNLYVEVDFGVNYPKLNKVVYDYFDENFDLTNIKELSNYRIYVGDKVITKNNLNDYKNKLNLIYSSASNPYSCVIGFQDYTDDTNYNLVKTPDRYNIVVSSFGIEGTVAGVKRLVSKKKDWMYYREPETDVIDDYDITGLAVKDFLNKKRLGENYILNDGLLSAKVRDILYDNNVDISVKTIRTLNTTSYNRSTQLRTKNLNIDYSKGFRDTFKLNKSPVVMAGGIYSNINNFEEFGRELVQEGQDVWLIEITGGPNSEDNTPYTYQDLEDYYVPALLAGVQYYSNKSKLNYVGHSNGCRSALTSLSKHYRGENNIGYVFENGEWLSVDLMANPVDKFFGIACPTTLNGLSGTSEVQREKDEYNNYKSIDAINNIRDYSNIYRYQFASQLNKLANIEYFLTNYKISLNLQEFYNNLSIDKTTSFSGNQNAANSYFFLAGIGKYPRHYFLNHYGGDGTVPLQDMKLLVNNFENSEIIEYNNNHGEILKNSDMKLKIMRELK